MSEIGDDMIARYVDGELDAEGVAVVDAAIAADPALGARIVRESHLRAVAARASGSVLGGHASDRPRRAVGVESTSAEIIRLDFRKPRFEQAAPRPRKPSPLPVWAAAAACVIVGVIAAQAFGPKTSGPFQASPRVGQPASAALATALDRKLSGEAGLVGVGQTFRDGGGAICRTFWIDRTAGVACRGDGAWTVRVTAEGPAAQTGQGGGPPAVQDAVAAMIVGEPFTRPEESAARDAGWT